MHRFDFFGFFVGEANVTSQIVKECTLTKSKHDLLDLKMFRPIGLPLWIRSEDLIMAGHCN